MSDPFVTPTPKTPPKAPAPAPAKEPDSASDRLREFEDEHFGEDALRINGEVEKGHGSKFAEMSDEDKAVHAALEQVIVAEKTVATAAAAHLAAEDALASARKAADAAGAKATAAVEAKAAKEAAKASKAK